MSGGTGAQEALRTCVLFHNLDEPGFAVVERHVEDVQTRIGDYVFHEGDVGDAFYVIREGTVKITKNMPDGQKLTVVQLGEGELFGEMSLISEEPRTSNCVFVSNGRVWRLSREAFERLRQGELAVYTAIVKNIAVLLCERLGTMTSEVTELLRDLDRTEAQAGDLEARLHRGTVGLMGFLKSLGGGAPQGR